MHIYAGSCSDTGRPTKRLRPTGDIPKKEATDYLKKSDKRQLLNWEKATNYDLWYRSKVTATFITIKQATKQLQN